MGKHQLSKVSVKASVKVDAYEVICRAIEEGIGYGWNRAHKHTAHPSEEEIRAAMYNAISNELCEVLKFD